MAEPITTAGTTPRIARLTREARAAAQAIEPLFAHLDTTQAAIITETGWSVAATLAHLASSYAPGLQRTVITRSQAGKSLNLPAWIIHLSNWIASIQNRRAALAQSAARFARDLDEALALIARLSDADLDRQIVVPLQGAASLEAYLRYVFVGHLAEHGAQIERALAAHSAAHLQVRP